MRAGGLNGRRTQESEWYRLYARSTERPVKQRPARLSRVPELPLIALLQRNAADVERAARSAGTAEAVIEISASRADTANSVIGSYGPTPNSRAPITRIAAGANRTPIATAPAVSNACRRIRYTMSPTEAPSAIRMPISRVRAEVMEDITPYTPTADSIRAKPANAPTSHAISLGWAKLSRTTSSNVSS